MKRPLGWDYSSIAAQNQIYDVLCFCISMTKKKGKIITATIVFAHMQKSSYGPHFPTALK